jgi:hypothetical protein
LAVDVGNPMGMTKPCASCTNTRATTSDSSSCIRLVVFIVSKQKRMMESILNIFEEFDERISGALMF